MKAYNKVLLKNKWVQNLTNDWASKSLLTESARQAIKKEYAEVPYQPHWFVWIGLFIFTFICISSGSILFFPFIDVPGAENFLSPLYGVALFFFLNYVIKDRKLHFSGIDNALLYSILLTCVLPVVKLTNTLNSEPWVFALCFLPFLLFLTYRYGEPLIALNAFLNGFFIIAALSFKTPWGKLFLPFIAILYAGIIGYFVYGFLQKEESFYWKTCLQWVLIASLALFYLGGNYAVVREGNAALNSLSGNSPEITFALFFWFLTFIIPVLYIYAAFRLKNLSFLIVGSIALIASLATLNNYHELLPGEWALTLLGAAGIATSVLLMRYFSTARLGFVYAPEKDTEVGVWAGNLVAMQVTGNVPNQPEGTPLGGGDFGGGGSGDAY